ncbi:hypothetical protein [Caldimonas tepidiphila]|uniref:hypothetical protein n=1 Tax=Caldimonas tepidiphila TaxID=2315841 RepID=UPI001300196F|nr:hypothetical protein [Caldimonas tepidiphila]
MKNFYSSCILKDFGLFWACMSVAIWFLARPYEGMVHDAIFYAADALNHLSRENFKQDLFFSYGTQGDYSIFGWAYSYLIEVCGLDGATLLLAILGKLVWLGSLLYLCLALFSWERAVIAFSSILIIHPYYGAYKIFSYGEPFVTPRIWAEAASLLSLSFFVGGNAIKGWGASLVAFSLHPLMALPGPMVGVFLLSPSRRNKAIVGGVFIFLGLWIARLDPFFRISSFFDKEWLSVVEARNAYVLFRAWPIEDVAQAFFWLVLLLGAQVWGGGHDRLKKLCWALACVGALLLVAWVIGDGLNNVLLTQLQLWRVLWIVKIAAILSVVGGITSDSTSAENRKNFFILAAAMFLFGGETTSLVLALVAVAMSLVWKGTSPQQFFKAENLLIKGIFFVAIVHALSETQYNFQSLRLLASEAGFISFFASSLIIIFGGGFIVAVALRRVYFPARARCVLNAIGVFFAAAGIFSFCNKKNEFPQDLGVGALKSFIPVGSVVHWDGEAVDSWLYLGRAIYASPLQGASALFDRDMSLELKRRLTRLQVARGSKNPLFLAKEYFPNKSLMLSGVEFLCEDEILDFVILRGKSDYSDTQFILSKGGVVSVFDCGKRRNS